MPSPGRRLVAGDNLVWYNGNQFRILDAVGPDVVKWEEDFTAVAVASDAVSGWTVTLVEAGGGESTITRPDASAGALVITTDNFEDDGAQLQVTTGEAYGCSSSQDLLYFGIRFKAGEATQSDFIVGLCITDTTLLGGMTDGIYFRKVDGSTAVSFVTEKDSTETETETVLTFVADTYYLMEFAFDQRTDRVFAFVDGSLVATHSANICDDELLTPSIAFLTGNAAIETMTIDYVRVIQIGR